jgi:myb proto-oncogene protein
MGQAPFLTTMPSQEGNNPTDSSWVLSSPTPVLATVTDTSISNPGDASSTTSSYGGGTSSYWPEHFFEDPIMHEIS